MKKILSQQQQLTQIRTYRKKFCKGFPPLQEKYEYPCALLLVYVNNNCVPVFSQSIYLCVSSLYSQIPHVATEHISDSLTALEINRLTL